jgi:hypothetical protein
MQSFKEYLKKLKRKKRKQEILGTLTPVRKDSASMPNTAMLPAATGGNQPRLS